jgi:hypothetical protein
VRAGYEIRKEQYGLMRGGGRFFGTLDLGARIAGAHAGHQDGKGDSVRHGTLLQRSNCPRFYTTTDAKGTLFVTKIDFQGTKGAAPRMSYPASRRQDHFVAELVERKSASAKKNLFSMFVSSALRNETYGGRSKGVA